ncbi:MAG TPA: hypothetical protein VN025_05790, partial [Candidatus Dormibacteraeota bacterium]|nr:hypothetical protein [Candidatus Dormibacteraeota bacterium]
HRKTPASHQSLLRAAVTKQFSRLGDPYTACQTAQQAYEQDALGPVDLPPDSAHVIIRHPNR